MTIALVGADNDFSTTSDGFTSKSMDTTGANFIVMALCDTAGTGTITDSKSNTWIPLTEYTGFFGTRAIKLVYAYNATVGTGHTFTVSGTAGLNPAISVAWYSGVQSSSDPLDAGKISGANNDSSTTIAPGSLTPTTDGSLVVTGLFKDGSFAAAPTINASFTRRTYVSDAGFGHFAGAIADLIQTTAAAANPTWTTESDIVIATMAVFKAASGGGGSNFTISVDDLSATNDEAVRGALKGRTTDDTNISPIDLMNSSIKKGRTVDDLIVTSDSVLAVIKYRRVLDDTISTIDDVTVTLTGAGNNFVVTVSDTASLIDDLIRSGNFYRLTDDLISVTDDPGIFKLYIVDFIDPLAVIDSSNQLIVRGRTADEFLSLIDEALVSRGYSRVVDEPVIVIDDIAVFRKYSRQLDEAIAFIDLVAAQVFTGGGTSYVVVADEGITLIDDAMRIVGYRRFTDDTIVPSDDAMIGILRGRTLDDTFLLSELLVGIIGRIITLQMDDTLDVTDAALRYVSAVRDIQDTASLADDLIAQYFPFILLTYSPRARIGADPPNKIGAETSGAMLGGYN